MNRRGFFGLLASAGALIGLGAPAEGKYRVGNSLYKGGNLDSYNKYINTPHQERCKFEWCLEVDPELKEWQSNVLFTPSLQADLYDDNPDVVARAKAQWQDIITVPPVGNPHPGAHVLSPAGRAARRAKLSLDIKRVVYDPLNYKHLYPSWRYLEPSS